MAEQNDVYDAKTHFSRLIEHVEHGEEIVIGRAGRPVARLVSDRSQRGSRTPGGWEGRVTIAQDFDELPEELAAAFRGQPHVALVAERGILRSPSRHGCDRQP